MGYQCILSLRRFAPFSIPVLDRCGAKPAMYVGHESLKSVTYVLSGYCLALEDLGIEVRPLAGFQRWVELQYLIFDPAWHWSRILLHKYGTDRKAFDALPGLYSRFIADREEKGVDGIEAELKDGLLEHRGGHWYRPRRTRTTD